MPELPEVETTRRGIEPALRGQRIAALQIHDARLRWPVDPHLPRRLRGQRIRRVTRRAKYLLLHLDAGTLIVHLGMSGNLRVLAASAPRRPHDHLDLVLESGRALRFNDPRRFGSFLYTTAPPEEHPLLRHLAPEPLEPGFDAQYLHRITRGRRVAIKQLLMNARLVTGVGNIYASEALFRARLAPTRPARRLSLADCARLVRGTRAVLTQAIRSGGTTLRDYVGADGAPGYFRQKLYVYERAGRPCRVCGTPIRQRRQGQRSTYHCPHCQR
ncbi:MAG: bifunctional DNA-formamidopyrimidine glycosylase/DNA-(apurinic or apyrimidinic site) lyase [Gammaproteobacteria bacterium]|nr:bifunctional DNA-formamidopyrimidine glycosylase/DNA-(apurinic or apyrimidinic site) lyase [Gammaproteobacteria bacterium]